MGKSHLSRIMAAVMLVLSVLSAQGVTAAEGQAWGIVNSSFEMQEDGQPLGWSSQVWGGKAEFSYVDGGHTGKKCVKISSQSGGDAAWKQVAVVRPFARYRLSGWIKTRNVKAGTGKGALLNLHEIQPLQTRAISGTSGWTRVELVFETGDRGSVQVNCLFGGWGKSAGEAWYDDIELELLSRASLEPAIVIDAGRTGEAISPYIYGQFIEHLGRCIYGGIWAEMLEDRKFYYPITTDYNPWRSIVPAGKHFVGEDVPFKVLQSSPWQIIGPSDGVKMVKDGAYTGEHSPVIQLKGDGTAGGIAQNDLALSAGKSYVGRVVISTEQSALPVVVKLVWDRKSGSGDSFEIDMPNRRGQFVKYPFQFRCRASTPNGRLEIFSRGKGKFVVGAVSLMPADNIDGFRADTMKLLKELDAPVYRWPGGNFVSGYNWKDGIGDRDRRPPRKNPAWTGVEYNDVGIDEFMQFCRLLHTEPYITVNTGLGSVESARQEVEYCNGGLDSPMGKWRAQQGHPEPYKVKLWAVGNEMYGSWQLGHTSLGDYIKRHNSFVDAMRKVDPEIKVVAVGSVGPWSEQMLSHCADHMDYMSEHFYVGRKEGLWEHVAQVPRNIKRIAQAHRRYRRQIPALKGKDIRIAMDEWNYWYGPNLYGELGVRYYLRDGLGIAAGLHEYFRNSDIYFMANYAQTVNVIGCIKTTRTHADFATTGLVLKMYRSHFGKIPVAVDGDMRPLDISAALTGDGRALTVAVVNPTRSTITLTADVMGVDVENTARRWTVTADSDMACNIVGQEPQVKIVSDELNDISREVRIAPLSISIYRLKLRGN